MLRRPLPVFQSVHMANIKSGLQGSCQRTLRNTSNRVRSCGRPGPTSEHFQHSWTAACLASLYPRISPLVCPFNCFNLVPSDSFPNVFLKNSLGAISPRKRILLILKLLKPNSKIRDTQTIRKLAHIIFHSCLFTWHLRACILDFYQY